jgi:hypothetical protein
VRFARGFVGEGLGGGLGGESAIDMHPAGGGGGGHVNPGQDGGCGQVPSGCRHFSRTSRSERALNAICALCCTS